MKTIVTVRATEDITRYIGDIKLEAKAGDVLEVNPRQAEVALALGGFDLVSVQEVADENPADVASTDAGEADSNAAADVASTDAPAKRKKKTTTDETAPADEKADTETTEE